ncbi:hypothetical protein FG002_007220 [Chitinimonas sp. BJB300]|nr:hypothetical protein FG002_007220 [Chitinimonas sp. BJB300]
MVIKRVVPCNPEAVTFEAMDGEHFQYLLRVGNTVLKMLSDAHSPMLIHHLKIPLPLLFPPDLARETLNRI